MTEASPLVYLFYGEDEFSIAQQVSKLESKLGDAASLAMNVDRLDGRQASLNDIRLAVLAIPFLSERRLVILYHPTARLGSPALQEKFKTLLDDLPESTRLVLIEHKDLVERKGKSLKKHWLLEWAEKAGSRVYIRPFQPLKEMEMSSWIQGQARELGGQIAPQAAALLSSLVGGDTRLAHNELQKLLTYTAYSRPVHVEDVESLTPLTGQADIFEMVDALGNQDGRTALIKFHRLLEEQDFPLIFGMVVRQFRLLLLAREVMDSGGREAEVSRALGMPDFIARKICSQARPFSLPVLEGVYRRLLDLDESMKTGQMEGELALDTFIAAFTAR